MRATFALSIAILLNEAHYDKDGAVREKYLDVLGLRIIADEFDPLYVMEHKCSVHFCPPKRNNTMKYEKLQQKSYLFVYDSLLLFSRSRDTVSLASLRRQTLRVSPTIEANKNTLETFLKLGATFFPVSIYLDSDTHKVAKIPNVKE
jgi:hypothetical protein